MKTEGLVSCLRCHRVVHRETFRAHYKAHDDPRPKTSEAQAAWRAYNRVVVQQLPPPAVPPDPEPKVREGYSGVFPLFPSSSGRHSGLLTLQQLTFSASQKFRRR